MRPDSYDVIGDLSCDVLVRLYLESPAQQVVVLEAECRHLEASTSYKRVVKHRFAVADR